MESVSRDADDLHGSVVDPQRAPDDVEIGSETAPPEITTEHDNRIGARRRFVIGAEYATQRGRHAEHVEVVARDQLDLDPLGSAPIVQRDDLGPPA